MATVTYAYGSSVQNLANAFRTNGDQFAPSVTALANGSVLAAWQEADSVGGALRGVVISRTGQVLSSSANTFLNSSPNGSEAAPVVQSLANGNAVVAWQGFGGVYFRIVDPLLQTVTLDAFVAQTVDSRPFVAPEITRLTDGGFVIAYQRNFSTTDRDIFRAVYNADGSLRAGGAGVATSGVNEYDPQVAATTNGGFVMTWTQDTANGSKIIGQRFTASGGLDGAQFTAYEGPGFNGSESAIVGLPSNGFAMAFRLAQGAGPGDIVIRSFTSSNLIVANNNVTSASTTDKIAPAIALLSNGFIQVSWTNPAETVNGTATQATVYNLSPGNAVAVASIVSNPLDQGDLAALPGARTVQVARYAPGGSTGYDIRLVQRDLVRTTTSDGTAETLVGDDLRDVLVGGGGADQLTGGSNADVFRYTAISDSLPGAVDTITDFESFSDIIEFTSFLGSGGAVAINRSSAVSTVYFKRADGVGGTGQIFVNGIVQGSDVSVDFSNTTFYITGYDGTDVIYGSAGVDFINGGGGNDHILGGAGADTLTGGAGVDVFYYQAVAHSTQAAPDTLTDFQSGVDKVDIAAATGAGGVVALNRTGSTSVIYFAAPGGGAVGQINVSGLVQGYDFAAAANTTFYINGDAGPDTIYGTGAADVINGGGGDDNIAGGNGADQLTGGAGADTFYYQVVAQSTAGAVDTLTDFQSGQDRIDVNQAIGAGGLIAVNRSGGLSTVYFQRGDGSGGTGQIAVTGTVNGYDFVPGTNVTVFINGDDGSDVIYGSNVRDFINGGGGNDNIAGGGGADQLTGGAGSDTFYYFAVADSPNVAPDAITDFTIGQDRINLTALGVGTVTVNNAGSGATVTFSAGGGSPLQINVSGLVRFADIDAAPGSTFSGNGAPVGNPDADYAPALVGYDMAVAEFQSGFG